MKVTAYKTISKTSTGEFKDRGSKFIAFAYPFQDINDLNKYLDELKSLHPSSRHFCYGYRVGVGANEKIRMNDDGEPSNSAGAPIFGQIQSFEITNCLIIVLRYFGGVKLGVGGLINAYREAAKVALEKNQIVEKEITNTYQVIFPYDQTSFVEQLLHKNNMEVINQDFSANCKWKIAIPLKDEKAVIEQLENNQYISYTAIQ